MTLDPVAALRLEVELCESLGNVDERRKSHEVAYRTVPSEAGGVQILANRYANQIGDLDGDLRVVDLSIPPAPMRERVSLWSPSLRPRGRVIGCLHEKG